MEENEKAELVAKFREELKGPGSLAPFVDVSPSAKYVGYDIHPENVEALFFTGIGVPRWESFEGDNQEAKEAAYMTEYNNVMTKYPMIARANDTFEHVEYSPEDAASLLEECKQVIAQTSDEKARSAAQKFAIAAAEAVKENAGLKLNPRQE